MFQALTKKMKTYGLWISYKNHDELHLFIKKVMAKSDGNCFAQTNAYQLLFNQFLKRKLFKPFIIELTKFMFYFKTQWMISKIRKMVTFYDVNFKTNNWSESNNRKRR